MFGCSDQSLHSFQLVVYKTPVVWYYFVDIDQSAVSWHQRKIQHALLLFPASFCLEYNLPNNIQIAVPKRKEYMQFWNVIVDRVCLWHWQISPDINKSGQSIDAILNNLHPLFISRLLVYSCLFTSWKLKCVHLWSGTFLVCVNSLELSIKDFCRNTVKIDPIPLSAFVRIGPYPSSLCGRLFWINPFDGMLFLMASIPIDSVGVSCTWTQGCWLKNRQSMAAGYIFSSCVERFPNLHLGKIDWGWTQLIFSVGEVSWWSLPRWLSGLRHSAQRPERSAGEAGFNPRVGR